MKNFSLLFLILSIGFLNAQDLKKGDGFRVTFYNISDQISGDYFIQQDGIVQLPFIGILKAEGQDFNKLKTLIFQKYDSLYRNPEINIQPLLKINILGEVKSPGIYYVTGYETLTDLLALAGGETGDADLDDIYINRNDEDIEVEATKIIEKGDKMKDVGLQSGDRIYVPRRWWGSGARNVTIIISGITAIVAVASLLLR